MMIKEKKNRGFTLVEVIVSMLVLSITIVSVLSAFSVSAKANAKTKKRQSAESLLENLLEYTEAGGTDYATVFSATETVEQALSDTETVEIKTLSGVTQGSFEYDVKITKETKPDKYNTGDMNQLQAISFGATGEATILIDATDESIDTNAFEQFKSQHEDAVNEYNIAVLLEAAKGAPSPSPTITPVPDSELLNYIDKEIVFETEQTEPGRLQLHVYAYYNFMAPDSVKYPSAAESESKVEIYTSAVFKTADDPDSSLDELTQIYVLYKPSSKENRNLIDTYDVRIVDENQLLDANLYIAFQENPMDIANATTGTNQLVEYRPNKGETVRVTFKKDKEATSYVINPKRLDLYCSTQLESDLETGPVKTHAQTLTAYTDQLRVAEITFEVIDHDTGNVIMKETTVCLQ